MVSCGSARGGAADMGEPGVTRREFMAASSTAAAGTRQPVVVNPYPVSDTRVQQQPLRIVTMYPFEPFEAAQITTAARVTVELSICKTQEEFREKLKDAEVAYGSVRGADLPLAPKLKWVQA